MIQVAIKIHLNLKNIEDYMRKAETIECLIQILGMVLHILHSIRLTVKARFIKHHFSSPLKAHTHLLSIKHILDHLHFIIQRPTAILLRMFILLTTEQTISCTITAYTTRPRSTAVIYLTRHIDLHYKCMARTPTTMSCL